MPICGVADPKRAALCERVSMHDGDHQADGRYWPRTECWAPTPPGLALRCVQVLGHDGSHVGTAWRSTGPDTEPEAVRIEWGAHGVTWLSGEPLPRPAWTPNPLASTGP
ncbi:MULTISPECIES: hypothetical protein [Streptomyces]|uniref:hypothetical protein n=1 Tax=Streptomyces TaxID=1883 RepID=UPI00163B6247|nr:MULTISPECIES: hypothetical protein [Streptomyces]MBC2879813.1 hypothetical protein [Streptomyces sp. TYQ1024]UBI41419.1 hypothetical protein K7I03_33685 [Streptomyces mobaraensis]